jgi:LPS-assembly protein
MPPTVPPLAASVAPAAAEPDLITAAATQWRRRAVELTDDVEVRFGDRRVARKLPLRPGQQLVQGRRQRALPDPTIRVEGDSGSYGDNGANFIGARFELLQQPGRGAAESVDLLPDGAIELTRVSYTTCPKDATDWQLRARRITLNTDTLRGVGRDTRIEFKGVPILYLPWISFPLSDARQTGLLFPTLYSPHAVAPPHRSRYRNIAPQQT